MLEQFQDHASGGFYFVSHDHERLIQRPKSGHDGATPSGNGIAAHALQRLGHITGETRYLRAAERTIRVFLESMTASPSAHTTLSTALEEALAPPQVVVLRGAASELHGWQRTLARAYRPATLILPIADDIPGLPATLDKREDTPANVSAWVCTGVTCLPPVFELAELEQILATGQPIS